MSPTQPSDHSVRDATAADLPILSRILCASFQFLCEHGDYNKHQLVRMINERGSVESLGPQLVKDSWFLGFAGKTEAGVLSVNGNEICNLFVDPAQMRKGIGAMLYSFAESSFVKDGHNEMVLWSSAFAISFYEKMGMRVVEVIKVPYGPLVGVERTLMRKSLR